MAADRREPAAVASAVTDVEQLWRELDERRRRADARDRVADERERVADAVRGDDATGWSPGCTAEDLSLDRRMRAGSLGGTAESERSQQRAVDSGRFDRSGGTARRCKLTLLAASLLRAVLQQGATNSARFAVTRATRPKHPADAQLARSPKAESRTGAGFRSSLALTAYPRLPVRRR